MKIGVIGEGAIGRFVVGHLAHANAELHVTLTRPARVHEGSGCRVCNAAELPEDTELMVDCAGQSALSGHGPAILERGIDLVTVSLGALADDALKDRLEKAAQAGGARLHLASGAIGALDCLQAARIGGLEHVTYLGRKPPTGWKGSPAEAKVDLGAVTDATTHFTGTARHASLDYPKNANVAAAVALAGLGFDRTQVELIADPSITANIHEIHASGAFGTFAFRIEGKALPDNPRSSALAAMSVVAAIARHHATITL